MSELGAWVENRAQIRIRLKVPQGSVSLEEVDPTVPDWAKEPEKPRYTYGEIRDAPRELTNLEIEELLNSIGGL